MKVYIKSEFIKTEVKTIILLKLDKSCTWH